MADGSGDRLWALHNGGRDGDKPLVILDQGGFWQPLEALLKAVIAGGFADQGITAHYTVAQNIDGVFAALAAAPQSTGPGHPERL